MDVLTPRQKELIHLLDSGLEPKRAASRMGLSYETVRAYQKRIGERLGLDTSRLAKLLAVVRERELLDAGYINTREVA